MANRLVDSQIQRAQEAEEMFSLKRELAYAKRRLQVLEATRSSTNDGPNELAHLAATSTASSIISPTAPFGAYTSSNFSSAETSSLAELLGSTRPESEEHNANSRPPQSMPFLKTLINLGVTQTRPRASTTTRLSQQLNHKPQLHVRTPSKSTEAIVISEVMQEANLSSQMEQHASVEGLDQEEEKGEKEIIGARETFGEFVEERQAGDGDSQPSLALASSPKQLKVCRLLHENSEPLNGDEPDPLNGNSRLEDDANVANSDAVFS
ncbi:unnamed protein product, partial [Protopolystoma xenopodis]